MGIAKISPIVKEFPQNGFKSFESSLSQAGLPRVPGTTAMKFPYKEANGKYRTGLDENATYLHNMSREDREAEIERIRKDRARLEDVTGFDLGPTSQYYNYSANLPDDQKIQPIKLGTQEKFFDLNDPIQEIAWNWIKVHPTIAPSMQAFKRGDVHPDMCQYYVADDNVETLITFNKKKEINKAIGVFDELEPTRKKKIARLMGLPVSDATSEEVVYNLMDSLLKDGEFKEGENKGGSTIHIFNDILKMSDERVHVKDLVNQAISFAIFRTKNGGRLYEGDSEVAKSKGEYVEYLMDVEHQDDLIALEKRLNVKKLK
jgi:hypothetical protein